MKKSRFAEEQVAYALRQAEAGTPVGDVCRQLGIAEATFYVWKTKYGQLGVTELRKVRMLEDENARLKRLVADLTLDRHILQEVLRKMYGPPRNCKVVEVSRRQFAQMYPASRERAVVAATP